MEVDRERGAELRMAALEVIPRTFPSLHSLSNPTFVYHQQLQIRFRSSLHKLNPR
jgi:hypothetical protein